MKKFNAVILAVILLLSLLGCGISGSSTDEGPLSASQIAEKLKKEYKLPLTQEVTYTEETDLNELLGRPNQYTSKTNWNDKRDENKVEYAEDADAPAEALACTVEVFANPADAGKRKEYIESVWNSGGTALQDQYIYLSGNALLRLSYGLTPDEAAEYEKAFYKIMKADK